MAKNIRSEYVRDLVSNKKKLEEQLSSVTNDTIKEILTGQVSSTINKMLNESDDDDDSFKEEEVKDGELGSDIEGGAPEDGTADDGEVTEPAADDSAEEGGDAEGEATDDATATDAEGEGEGGEEWGDLEKYKDEDGEYDLTGMDNDSVIKVLKVMDPETDGVHVMKNDNGTISLKDDETEKEYIIDIDGAFDEGDGAEGESPSDDVEYSIDIDDELGESRMNEENLGYTDNYQSETAMTTPDNHEPADPKSTYSMDGGVPTGTAKPFANQGDKSPFTKKVSEGCEGAGCNAEECSVNETMTTQEEGPYNRGDGMVHTNTNSKAAKGRNSHAGGQQVHGTADNSYSEAQLESIKRKANQIYLENRELKKVLPLMEQRLEEAVVINQSLSNILKLISENSTTVEEKAMLTKRFNDAKTREESNALYHQISEELRRSNSRKANVNEVINSQMAEATSVNEQVEKQKKAMYESKDLNETLSFMHRLDKI